jgi:cell division protein FtsB
MAEERDDVGLLAKRREFLDTYFRKGAEFAQELLHDNERLRFRIAQLEEELATARPASPSSAAIRELLERIERLEAEREALASRFREVEDLNRDFEARYGEIERENNDLANLYIASSQLNAALEPADILATVIEVVLNFVGAKVFAVLWRGDEGAFEALAAEGIDPAAVPRLGLGDGPVAEALRTGRVWAEPEVRRGPVDLAHPVVCVPLTLRHEIAGAIVIWGFLAQKEALANVDFELFKLLGLQVAPALKAARLCGAPEDGGAHPTLGRLRESLEVRR